MTYIETPGVQGAAKRAWKPKNTRQVFEQIMRDNPRADRERITKLYREAIEGDEDYLRTDLEYCCDNHWLAWEHQRRKPSSLSASSLGTAMPPSPELIQATEQLKGMVLMMLTMPNGKPLGDCTGSDLTKIGGWFGALRSKVGPRQTVRSVLSEEDLRQAWNKRR